MKRFDFFDKYLIARNAKKQIAIYMETKEYPRCLHLGCGNNLLPGWLNTDIIVPIKGEKIYLDAVKTYPFPDDSFDYIFSEHMLEHLLLKDAVCMLLECKRVLKDNGVIRITIPDMKFLLDMYLYPEKYEEYLKWSTKRFLPEVEELFPGKYPEVFVINNFYRDWGHQVIYDYKTLEMLLYKCGYKNVVKCEVGNSDHTVLQGIEKHDDVNYPGLTKIESMVVEASC
ncbi:class I SAM-dependent methyltransferase [Parabacteroides sp.]